MLTRLLIAVDDAELGARLERCVTGEVAATVDDSGEAGFWRRLEREDFDLALVDRAIAPSPTALLEALQELPDAPTVVFVTRDEDPTDRATLLSAGAAAVLPLALDDHVLASTIDALASRHTRHRIERIAAERTERRAGLEHFVAESDAMRRFLETARRVVRGDSPILVLGETGVGKERLARSVHADSARSRGPFITVHCGALPENLLESELFGHEKGAFTGASRARRGFFELAHRGTLFLDEIGEMPVHLQVKLLRALEDRAIYRVGGERAIEVDARILAATNRDLKTEMTEKRFRPDLYYRLAVVTLSLPPLRERVEDIPGLAEFFLARIRHKLDGKALAFEPEAMSALRRHDWPGNVRELVNVIERAALLAPGDVIRLEDLRGDRWTGGDSPPAAAGPEPRDAKLAPHGAEDASFELPYDEARAQVLGRFEKSYLERLLTRTRGRVGETARLAGINARTLYAMMKRHGLRKETFRRAASTGSR